VANAIASIEAGLFSPGTINGYGERTGNCNLTSVIPILELKLKRLLPAGRLAQLSDMSHFVDEMATSTTTARAVRRHLVVRT